MVDANDHVMVPPENPSYRIRRVWLTSEEEAGYYYGFANEGLWPLCHIAHTRPVFRASDWEHYRAVNRRFAETVVSESRTPNPIVLVQDYHFALLPRMIRERLPEATIIAFWHIPWPNPEAFGICPWRSELLEGLLGSSILGFHTQFHCNNFFDTVDRYLEARVDRETFTISYGGEPTEVHRYPISIEWPLKGLAEQPPVAECRKAIREQLGLGPTCAWAWASIASTTRRASSSASPPSSASSRWSPPGSGSSRSCRSPRPAARASTSTSCWTPACAQQLSASTTASARPGAGPSCSRSSITTPGACYTHYRAADFCFVSSLHDGMNLVAKEFVATREDERGVLVLSQFTGAARELPEALIVNPYDTEQCAAAVREALTMPPDEQRARMRSMRALLLEFNVYRWAGRMLLDAARMRNRRRLTAGARVPAIAAGARRT